jgi:hypothetical protein
VKVFKGPKAQGAERAADHVFREAEIKAQKGPTAELNVTVDPRITQFPVPP